MQGSNNKKKLNKCSPGSMCIKCAPSGILTSIQGVFHPGVKFGKFLILGIFSITFSTNFPQYEGATGKPVRVAPPRMTTKEWNLIFEIENRKYIY